MDGLKDNSEKVRRTIQARLTHGLNNANEFLMAEAQAGAPVKSGELREGIDTVSEATPENPAAVGAARAPYSAVVNRRTSFWLTAWLRMKDDYGRFFKQ